MKLQYATASDVGRVRQHNQDSFLAAPDLGIFAVADGMGGHAAGEVASRIAVDSLREFIARSLRESDSSSAANLLENAVQFANQTIYESSRENREYQGMGTTLVAVYFSALSPAAANVGDSRLYQLRGKNIWQVTEDHSLVWERYRHGLIAREDLSLSPYKNIVTRALGIQPKVDVDVSDLRVQPGDFLILCSDGLSDTVKDEEMLTEIHKASGDLNRACDQMVRLANLRGGKDNITVLLIHLGPD